MYDNDDTDPYTDPATGVLRNKLDIADAEELAVVEDHVVTIRLAVCRREAGSPSRAWWYSRKHE